MSVSNPKKGIIFNSISVFLNAIVPLFSKWSMQSFKPLEVAFLICILNVLFCLLWRRRMGVFESLHVVKGYLKVAVVNAFGIICLYTSLGYLDPIAFGFISRFYVIFTTLISIFILREGASALELFSIVIGVVGTFFLASSGATTWTSILGIGFALLFTLCFAIVNFLIKSSKPTLHPVGILFCNNTTASFVILVFLIPDLNRYSSFSLVSIHALGILAAAIFSFGSLALLFSSYKHLSFRLTSLIRATNPLVSAVVALPFFPVNLTRGNWLGAFLLFLSIVILGFQERKG